MTRSIRFLLLSVALGLMSFTGIDKAAGDVTGTCNVHCENGTTFRVQATRVDCCTIYLGQCAGDLSYATWSTVGSTAPYCYPIQSF